MADTKISALADGGPAQTTDLTVIARGGANYSLTLAEIQTLILASADVVKLAESALGSPAAAVTFSSIPATYRHLRIVASGAGDTAATFITGAVTVNSDTGSNYDQEEHFANGTSPGSAVTYGGTSMALLQWPAASAPSGTVGSTTIEINDYRGTTFHKGFLARSQSKRANSGTNYVFTSSGGVWRSTVAINAITITASAGNFATGSVFTLYGLR